MRHWLWLAFVGAFLLAAPASAQAPNADDAFRDARTRFEAGDFRGALPLFRQALAASGSPNARIYVARCLRDLGQLVEGYEEMSRTVRDARELAPKEERYAQTRDQAAAELAVLEGRVGKVLVALDPSLQGATVELDGAPLTAERLGVPIAVLPGRVVVAAVRRDGTRIEQSKTVAPGALETLLLSGAAGPAAAVTTPPPPGNAGADTGGEAGGFGAVRGAGIGVALLGVAGFVTFGVGTAMANDKLATLESACGGVRCTDPAYGSVVDEGKRAETLAGVGLGIGIAGVAVGAAMIAFGGGDGEATVTAGPGGATLRLRF
ncbi:MAG: tetratricopeptide repeat protein [Polyangiaceae bacterium]|nr:tetratricopeptide repeat protein [Polyangiaceae bacterium]